MRTLSLVLLLGACGGDNTAPFVGIWKNTGGSSTTTCPGNVQTAMLPANTFTTTVAKNGTGTVILATSDGSGNNCNLTATVISNTTASLTPGASCNIGGGTLTSKSGNFIVGAGVTAELTLDATATGGGVTCDETFDIPLIQ